MSMTKIVLVAGQEFSVPVDTDNEAIRQQLTGMGFTDVAGAEIKTTQRDGTTYIEFIKKAGTKGLTGSDLATVLSRVPPDEPELPGLSPAQAAVLNQLTAGQLTCADALALLSDITAALDWVQVTNVFTTRKGTQLCRHIDMLPAVPATGASGW